MWGPFTAHCYKSILDGIEHIAMVKVSVSRIYTIFHNILVLHSRLFTAYNSYTDLFIMSLSSIKFLI